MMTLHAMFCAANKAAAAGRLVEAVNWRLLAQLIGESEARARLRTRRDPDQEDVDGYVGDMSLGGRTYRVPR